MGAQDEKTSEAADFEQNAVNASEAQANTKDADSSDGGLRRLYNRLAYVPPRCRYDPEKPFQFSMGMNILFGTSNYTRQARPYADCF